MKTSLYRHFDKNGELLYIGMAGDVEIRTKQHKRSVRGARIASTTIKVYATRIKAAIAELQAIDKERPHHNVMPGDEKRRRLRNAVMFSSRVPKELIEQVNAICEKRGLSRSDFIRTALEKALTTA